MPISFSAFRRSKTVHTIAIFTTGNTVAMILGVIGSLVQARYVGPDEMGIFRTFSILTGYLTFLHLGVFDGLHREIPIQLGRENHAKAEQAASACLVWIAFISIVGSVFFLGLAAHAAYNHDWMRFWGWLAFTPGIIGIFYGGYLGATFRTGQQFIRLTKISIIQAIAGTIVLPLMPIMGYYGACLRTAVSTVANMFFLHRWRPMKVRPRVDWPIFFDVIRIGLPLSGIGYIYTSLWVSLEGTFVLEWFGITVLGLYAISVFVRTVVVQLAQNMTQVMSVKIYEQYGRSGKVKDCVRMIFNPTLFAFLASLPLILVGWIALPWVVNLLIPKYIGAISMMRVMLLSLPIAFLGLPVIILWATGHRGYCFASVIVGFVAFVGLSYFLYQSNTGVLSVPIASILGQVINVLVSYMLILRLVRHENRMNQPETDMCVESQLA